MRNLILFLLFPLLAFGLTDVDRQELVNKNIMTSYNPGFESGKGSWVASGGTFLHVTSGTNLLIGKGSATWDSGSASQTLSGPNITIPKGLYGANGLFQCLIQTPSGTATHKLQVYDGTNVLAEATITSSTVPLPQGVNFAVPSSGSIRGRIISVASDEPLIAVDDCYLGRASNIQTGTIVTPWASYVPTLVGFGTVSNLEAFWRRVGDTLEVRASWTNGTVTGTEARFPFPTGLTSATTSAMHVAGQLDNGNTSSDNRMSLFVESAVTYFTFGRASDLATKANGNSYNNSERMKIIGSAQIAGWAGTGTSFTQDQVPGSWSGYHAQSDCSWARTNTALGDPTADSTCTFTEVTNVNFGSVTSALSSSDKLPGITWTPKRVGRYHVCVTGQASTANSNQSVQMSLTDGSTIVAQQGWDAQAAGGYKFPFTLCGNYYAATTAAQTLKIQTAVGSGAVTLTASSPATHALSWSIFALDQAFPAPLLIGSVTNSGTSSLRIEVAKLNCDAGSAITSQLNGSNWVASIGNISSGACTVTLTAGTFLSTPICIINDSNTSNLQIMAADPTSATSVTIDCSTSGGGTCSTYDPILTCIGVK